MEITLKACKCIFKINSFLKRKRTVCRTSEMTHVYVLIRKRNFKHMNEYSDAGEILRRKYTISTTRRKFENYENSPDFQNTGCCVAVKRHSFVGFELLKLESGSMDR
jgi:hypothetical protein